MSTYTNPLPGVVGQTVAVFGRGERSEVRFAVDAHHVTTITDASDPSMGGLTFMCSDGIAYRWEDEGVSWAWADKFAPTHPAFRLKL